MAHHESWRYLPALLGLLLLLPPVTGAGEEPAAPAAGQEVAPIRLEQSKSGSVLILEEDETGAAPKDPAVKDDGLSGQPAPALPPGHRAFRDQHVRFYVEDLPTGLDRAIKAAAASGGQLITYPIKGFDNMGPNERTLVFDARVYPSFLTKLEALGTVESPELGPSDFITVRLTVLKKKEPEERKPAAPDAGETKSPDGLIVIGAGIAAVLLFVALVLILRKKK
ncbi:MAG: hypothetical protein V1789_07825 [PVC group bacterium]